MNFIPSPFLSHSFEYFIVNWNGIGGNNSDKTRYPYWNVYIFYMHLLKLSIFSERNWKNWEHKMKTQAMKEKITNRDIENRMQFSKNKRE